MTWCAPEPDEHPRRALLLQLIRKQPGATFRQLCKASRIPAGTCRHHLTKLHKRNLIETRWDGNCERHFMADLAEEAQLAAIIRARGLDGLYSWLAVNGPQPQKEIIAAMATPYSTTQLHLRMLINLGVVKDQRRGRYRIYRATEAARRSVRL